MKKWAAFFLAAVLAFSAAAAYCESGISEIEKVLGVASFLLDSAIKKIEKEQKEAEGLMVSRLRMSAKWSARRKTLRHMGMSFRAR